LDDRRSLNILKLNILEYFMKRNLHSPHSLVALAASLVAATSTEAAAKSPGFVFTNHGADLDPLFMGVPKRPPLFDLATANCVNADGLALGQKANDGGGSGCKPSGYTKMAEHTQEGPLSNAKIFAAGNKDMMAARTLVAQTLAKTARTPAIAFA
jgi:hypothetical protein